MSWRRMADGIGNSASDPQAIHNTYGDILAGGYDTGSWAWTEAQWGLFPEASRIHIVTYLTNDGDVADVENGDLTPAQAGDWIATRKASGYYRPTVYCSAGNISAVRIAAGKWVLGKDYDIWAADWTNQPHQVIAPGPGPEVGCAVTQYQSLPWADLDAVYDPAWPHRTAPKPPPPPPTARGDRDMYIDRQLTGGQVAQASYPAGNVKGVEVVNGTTAAGQVEYRWRHAAGWYPALGSAPLSEPLPAGGIAGIVTDPPGNMGDVDAVQIMVTGTALASVHSIDG